MRKSTQYGSRHCSVPRRPGAVGGWAPDAPTRRRGSATVIVVLVAVVSRTMRILVDAAPVKVGGGGICTYLTGLLRGWGVAGFEDEWTVVGTAALPMEIDGLLNGRGKTRRGIGGRVPAQKHIIQQAYIPLKTCLGKARPDVVLCTTPVIPLTSLPVPIVALVHDLRYLAHPAEYSVLQRLYRNRTYGRGMRRADRLMAISRATSDAVEREIGRRPHVVPLGADHVDQWPKADPAGHGIAFAHWTNKRPEVAIRAWGILRKHDSRFSSMLHVVGCPSGRRPELIRLAMEHGVGDVVRVHEFLPEVEYQRLFRTASVVLMPSSLEGFGLPVVEAMRSGIPVVATDDPGLREAGGDVALYVAAGSAESFALHYESLSGDDARRAALVEGGLERARAFTWERTAQMTRKVLADAAGKT